MTAPKKNREVSRGGSGDNMPYLCWAVGRSNDARIQGLASRLGIAKATAIGYVLMLEELVYFHGEASGRIPDLTMRDVAATLGAPDAKRLEAAFKEASLLEVSGRGKRRALRHPTWSRSRTGSHIREREEDREYWRDRKREARRLAKEAAARAVAGQLAATAVEPGQGGGGAIAFSKMSIGHPVDVHPLSTDVQLESGHKEERKEGHAGSGAPPSPPRTAGGVGFARWERMQDLHQRPINPTACVLLLEAMTEEQWALCLWVLENREREKLSSLSKKKRAFGLDSYEFLRKSAYLQFRPEYRRKQAAPKEVPIAVEQAALERERIEGKRRSLREALEDPSLPEEVKAKKRKIYLEANPGDSLDWLNAPTNGVTH